MANVKELPTVEEAREEVESAAAAVRAAEVEAHNLRLTGAAAQAHISEQTSRLSAATERLQAAEEAAAERALEELPDAIGKAKKAREAALINACAGFEVFVTAVEDWHAANDEVSGLTQQLRSANKRINGKPRPGENKVRAPWRVRGSIPGDLRARVAFWAKQFSGIIMGGGSVSPERVENSHHIQA